jgi:hypothetical protein
MVVHTTELQSVDSNNVYLFAEQAYHEQCKENTVIVRGEKNMFRESSGRESSFGETDICISKATLIRMRLYGDPRSRGAEARG